ncbi:MAG: CotH kinase family protein [Vicingaceae bacterium]
MKSTQAILSLCLCFSFNFAHLNTKAQITTLDSSSKLISPVVAIVKAGDDLSNCSSCKVELYYLNTPNNKVKQDSTFALNSLPKQALKVKGKMHIRGRSTKSAQKKQYEFKLDKKSKENLPDGTHFMNMKHGGSHWTFNDAGAVDSTLIRNVFAFHLQRKLGYWAPRTKYFELFIISENASKLSHKHYLNRVIANPDSFYQGVYVLMEKIKSEKHRIDIPKFKDTVGSQAFILQLNPPEPLKYLSLPDLTLTSQVQIYEPKIDEMGSHKSQDSAYINQWYANWTQQALTLYTNYANDSGCPQSKVKGVYRPCPNATEDKKEVNKKAWKAFRSQTDYSSFAAYFLLNELARDPDGYHRSTFMYVKADSVAYAGPLWDKNKSFGNKAVPEFNYGCGKNQSVKEYYYNTSGWSYCYGGLGQSPVWWEVLLLDPNFSKTVWQLWQQERTKKGAFTYKEMVKHINKEQSYLSQTQAASRNAAKWYSGNKYYSFENNVEELKTYLEERLKWMDNNLKSLLEERSAVSLD